nr:RNA-directed DNA polymerase, eukaryota [Tanacetum cinerariifolium]
MTTTVVNNSLSRSLFEKQKLTENNFMEWYSNLRIVLSTEDKLPFLEQLIPVLPVPPEGQANPPDVVTTHQAWVKAQKEIAGLMLMTMEPDIQKNIKHLSAYDMLKELKTFLILVSLRKEHDGFVQKYNMHSMGKIVTGLHAMLKLHEQTLPSKEVAPALHAIRAGRTQKNQKMGYKGYQGKTKLRWAMHLCRRHLLLPNPRILQHPRRIIQQRTRYATNVETIGYSFYYPPEKKVFVARNAEFLENGLIAQGASGSLEYLKIIQEQDTHHSLDTCLDHEEDDQEINEPQSDINPIRRSTRTRHAPDRMCLYVDVEEHELGDLDSVVWELVDLPPNGKTVGHKWLFKKKTDMDGAVHTYIARLVAKGFTQTPRIDYEETFSPVADIRAIRILIAIVVFYDYEIWKIDIKTAFLNGYLNEERMQNIPYASAVGLIMYAVICTRPDVAFTQNITSRFQQNPGDAHWTAIKNILKYLRNTKDMFLVYGGDMKRELRVSFYTDVGYLTDVDDMKSQTGYVLVLNGGVVEWKSTKQSIFATSSTDAEYIVAFDASDEAVWIRKFIFGLGVVPTIEEPINMYCDNTGVIAIAKDHGVTKDDSDEEEQVDVISNEGESHDHAHGGGGDDKEMDEDLDNMVEEVRQVGNNLEEGGVDEQENKSEDSFQIYDLLKNNYNMSCNDNVADNSLKFPPGFTPQGSLDADSKKGERDNIDTEEEVRVTPLVEINHGSCGSRVNMNSNENRTESGASGHFRTSMLPRIGGSILGILDEVVKVGKVMGYNMDGYHAQKAKKDWVRELCIKHKVKFLALQETKMESMDILCVRLCWGNLAFEYNHSDSVGNSGGILCVWDLNSFIKQSSTRSDNFVMLRGIWRVTGQLVLLIVVYAPQDVSEKRLLWEYLQSEICKWDGKVVIMGDFNEVRFKSDRGSSFTWCHKSASKMSKLDRFLVSDSLLNSCPNINVITLERYLSDHCPILLREAFVDYSPTPFWFFHYWIEMEGFCKVVEDGWKDSSCEKTNAIRNLCGKLKYIKKVIRAWNKTNVTNVKNVKAHLKIDLEAVDARIDKGHGTADDIKRRRDIVSQLQDIDKLNALEMAQKAKVKWAVEGDENTRGSVVSFFVHSGGSVNLSHMFYADDVVFVGQWNEGNLNTLVHVLDCFKMASGLKINMKKSKIMGANVNREKIDRAATKLGCLVLKVPFLYLGSVVGGVMSRSKSWCEVVDRVKNRLSKWKLKTLSIGGRLTLLKSVLGSMPVFHMSIHKVPVGVKWKAVLASKERGGLGVSSLYALNRGLMFKWLWRFYKKDSSLWAMVITTIHENDGNVEMITKAGPRSCWLNIIHEVNVLYNKGINLNKFPRLYTLEMCKSISVSLKCAQSSLSDSFRRLPRGGAEQQQYIEMEDLVNDTIIAPMSDRLYWSLERSGEFTVASVRKLIDDHWLPGAEKKTRWIKYMPIKINVHAWKVMTDSIPTRFNISRRGISINSIRCVMCHHGVETSKHLFFSCDFARQVYRLIMQWWDVSEGDFESYEGWLVWLENLRLQLKKKLMLEGVFYVTWWLLWMFRNKRIYESKTL